MDRQTFKKMTLLPLVLLGVTTMSSAQDAALKPRIVVCTDIAPADVEPDDMESMVRLMAYSDMFEIEALITSVGWNCDPYPKDWAQYLHRVIDAYEKDVKNLMKRFGQKSFLSHDKENRSQQIGYWPSADYIRSRAVMGSERGGIKVIGEGNDSPGSDLLIRLADEDDPRPIYVAAWGGANTLAQAFWKVKQTRPAKELKRFVSKFRIYTITDQDMQYNMRMDRAYSSHQWLRKEFKDYLQFIWDEGTWQEQCELGKQNWSKHQQNIQGKGALGKEYPNYKWGVEGDTPSFLYVLPNGLNDPEDPTQAGWAGYHQRGLCPDSLTTAWTSWEEPVRSISVGYKQRFYPDELNDFMARMQWADKGEGNHNPIVVVNNHKGPSPLVLTVKAGDTVRLDASKSSDPDLNALSFHWWQQPEIGTAKVTIDNAESPVASIHIPADAAGQDLHIVCEVSDEGPFHLKAYQRIILKPTKMFTVVKQNAITSIKNQYRSGTCWDFATLSFFESEILRQRGKTYNLCEMFVVNKNYMDCATHYVRMHGYSQISEGGSCDDVLEVIRQHGICPEDAMPAPGSLTGDSLANFHTFFPELERTVSSIVRKGAKEPMPHWKDSVQAVIGKYVGHCPESFVYEGKTYTPTSFAESLGLNFDDYVSLTSYTHHPFYQWFAIEAPYKWRLKPSYNIPIEQLMEALDQALDAGYTVAWGGDVSGDFTRTGLAMLPDSIVPSQQLRQEQWDDWRFTYDHVMLIYGKATDEDGKPYYMVKNSWGESGYYKGTWYMSRDYMTLNTTYLFLNRHALPKELQESLLKPKVWRNLN